VADWPAALGAAWGIRFCDPGGDPPHAAVALKTAVDHLRTGGLVGLLLQHSRDQAAVPVPFFGGTLALPRGAAIMARRGGACVVPLTAAWATGRPRLTFHPPLELDTEATDPAAAEADLLARVAASFERAARADPMSGDRLLTAVIGQARRFASSAPAS
jgi:lauroyl/myristoyl acyltransferase